MLPFLFNPVGQMQGAYDQTANQAEGDYFSLLRKMAGMPNVSLPEQAQPQFDLKGMLIGSALAGLLGGGEGANAFLQGTMLGKQYSSQQDNVRKEQEYRKQKMAQDRELGILKTEAEIANAKANRAFQKAEGVRSDISAARREKAILDRQASTQRALDLRAAEEDMGNAKTIDQYDRALGRFNRAGGKMSPYEALAARKGIMDREKQVREDAQTKLYLPQLMKDMTGGKTSAVRINAANKVYDLLQRDPDHFLVQGMDPTQIAAEHKAAVEAAGELRISEQLGLQRVEALIRDKKLDAARLEIMGADKKLKDLLISEKSMLLKALPEKIRLEAQAARARILNIKANTTAKKEAKTAGTKPMTTNEYVNSVRQYTQKIQDENAAAGKLEAENEQLNKIISMIDDGSYVADAKENTARTKQQAQQQIAINKKSIDISNATVAEYEKKRADLETLRQPEATQLSPEGMKALRGAIGGARGLMGSGGGNKPLLPSGTIKLKSGSTVKIG